MREKEREEEFLSHSLLLFSTLTFSRHTTKYWKKERIRRKKRRGRRKKKERNAQKKCMQNRTLNFFSSLESSNKFCSGSEEILKKEFYCKEEVKLKNKNVVYIFENTLVSLLSSFFLFLPPIFSLFFNKNVETKGN